MNTVYVVKRGPYIEAICQSIRAAERELEALKASARFNRGGRGAWKQVGKLWVLGDVQLWVEPCEVSA